MTPRMLRRLILAALPLLALAACNRDTERDGGGVPTRVAGSQPTVVRPDFAPATDTLLRSAPAGANWPTYGGSYNNQRFSSLDQINRENVGELQLAWIYQTGIPESFETTPLVVGTVMYLSTPESHVVALNAATGEKLWEYIPALRPVPLCCGPNNRGVAAWGNKIFVGTLDARLVALDNRNGAVAWTAALVDTLSDEAASITMAPLAYAGKVFVGLSGGEFGIRGRVAVFDAETGKRLWVWNTIPSPDEAPNGWWGSFKETDPFGTPLNRDIAHERENQWQFPTAWTHGGGPVWTTPAYDPATNTLFFTVGNPSPDLNGEPRPGDNLYTGSIVALDGESGKLKWYFQYLPHDVWDLSPGSPPFLFTREGKTYVGHAAKTGWVYVVDAANGRPILRSDNFVPQENLFTPPTDSGVRMLPGANGGVGWSPVAYSPTRNLAYLLALNQPMVVVRTPQPLESGRMWLGGSFRYLPGSEQFGVVAAVDMTTGQIRWQRQTPRPNLGGVLATAGDLVFVGQADGALDAFDAETGDLLWQYPTGAGVSGGPITYAVNGIQYVAVASGGNHQLNTPRGDNLYVFTLRQNLPRRAGPAYPEPRFAHSGAARPGAGPRIPQPPATAAGSTAVAVPGQPGAPGAPPVPPQPGAPAQPTPGAPAQPQPTPAQPAPTQPAQPRPAQGRPAPAAPAAGGRPAAGPDSATARPAAPAPRPAAPPLLGRPVAPPPTTPPRPDTSGAPRG